MTTGASRVAIVTGAAQGIGRAIALRLAQDGLDVVVNDIPSKVNELEALVTELRATKRRSLVVTGDVSREADVHKIVDTAVAELGGLDVMVANAGICRTGPLISTPVEQWDFIHSVNARSVFLCYQAAAVHMIKQGRGGRIIGAGSTSGKQGMAEGGAYSASKFAVRGLTQAAAAEWGQYGITVNAYAPGVVSTPILKDIEDHRKQDGLDQLAFDPNWKVGQPEDVAGLVSYLVREESRFVTGQSMCINGGMYFD